MSVKGVHIFAQAAIKAMQSGDTHYTHSMGKIELRQAIAGYYKRYYGAVVSPEQIIVSQGKGS